MRALTVLLALVATPLLAGFAMITPTNTLGQVPCFNRNYSWGTVLAPSPPGTSKCHVHLRLRNCVICRTARQSR